MKAFLELIKILFIQQYRIKPIGNKKKQIGTIIALVVLALCFLPMIIGMAIIMYYIGNISAGNVGFCALLILMCQSLVMLFGLPAIISNVFNCKDADKLLPLPLKPISIFSAKLCVVYINEVLTTVLVILVTLLPFRNRLWSTSWILFFTGFSNFVNTNATNAFRNNYCNAVCSFNFKTK